jgi:hypothetical protein
MYVRKLTAEDRALIWKAKRIANDEIKKERKALRAEIKKLERQAGSYARSAELRDLDDRLKQLKPVTGKPVLVTAGDKSIYLHYEPVARFIKSLERNYYQGKASICGIRGNRKALIVEYGPNEFMLFELPLYQVNLLHDLPNIEIT